MRYLGVISFLLLLGCFILPSSALAIEYGIAKGEPKPEFYTLNPAWARADTKPIYNMWDPTWPPTIKRLQTVNQEDCPTNWNGRKMTDDQVRTYVDTDYVPCIQKLLNSKKIEAFEIWNEEDLQNGGTVLAAPYAYMIKKAAAAIKAKDPTIKVVMGGLASGNTGYITDVKNADPAAFNQVDGIGLHPYGKSPDGYCATGCSDMQLPFGDLGQAIDDYHNAAGMPIWITELGNPTTNLSRQAEYLKRSFTVAKNHNVPVVIWYKWNDTPASIGDNTFGLVDKDLKLKPSGQAFLALVGPAPTPMPTVPPTVIPTNNMLTVTLLLHGIGKGGDNANPSSGGNMNPRHPTRLLTLRVNGITDQVVGELSGDVIFDKASGLFKGQINFNKNTLCPTCTTVLLTAKLQDFLSKRLPGITNITQTQPITLPAVSFVAGDVNGDNKLDILDYNMVVSCYGSKQQTDVCKEKVNSDINDDGVVDGVDYNLFVREISVQAGD